MSGHAPDEWLVVIDPQAIFADPSTSDWGSPMWQDRVGRIRELCASYAGRVVITRFVADADPQGSWRPYYEQWPFAQAPDTDPLYAVVPELADIDATIVTRPTFGKWGSDLVRVVGETPRLVLAGVSTDCCVIATALPAADAGASIVVRADACAGSTPQNHEKALDLMALFGPQITIEGR
ncbi:cysteine hydrolase family protein [Calidifontibacter terrae]